MTNYGTFYFSPNPLFYYLSRIQSLQCIFLISSVFFVLLGNNSLIPFLCCVQNKLDFFSLVSETPSTPFYHYDKLPLRQPYARVDSIPQSGIKNLASEIFSDWSMEDPEEGPGSSLYNFNISLRRRCGPWMCQYFFYFSSMLFFNTERRKTRGDGSEVVIFAVLEDSGMGRGRTTEYAECQAFSAVVRIGSPRPLTRKRVLPPSWFQKGDTLTCGRGSWGS